MTLVIPLAIVAGPGTAAGSQPAQAVPADAQRQAALEAAESRAAEIERQRLAELTAQGTDEPAAVLRREQRRAAAGVRERILRLKEQGMSIDEIAAITPGLVVVSAPDDAPSVQPLTDDDDIELEYASVSFYTQCSCYSVESGWEWDVDPENGGDGVGLRVTKSILQMGGSAIICSSASYCDVDSSTTWEDPQGVVEKFDTARGDHHGTIAFSFRKISGGCHQLYTHYAHAWQGDWELQSVSIGIGGISFSFEQPGHQWSTQRAGGYTGC